jgi:hypothetical protein
MEAGMSITSQFEPFDRDKVFYDRETWEAMFEDSLRASPTAADSLAWLLYRVIRELDQGKKGRVVNTLKLGVEWIYLFTRAHDLSFQGYLYYLEGLLVPGDMPEELMKGVIERGDEQAREIAEAEQGEKRRGERRRATKYSRGKERQGR